MWSDVSNQYSTSIYSIKRLFEFNGFHLPIDGLIIPDSITKLFRNGHFSTNISILIGTTSAEFGLFIADGFQPGWQVKVFYQNGFK